MCYNRRAHVQSDHLLEKHLLSVYICSRDGCWGFSCPAGGRGEQARKPAPCCIMGHHYAMLISVCCTLLNCPELNDHLHPLCGTSIISITIGVPGWAV